MLVSIFGKFNQNKILYLLLLNAFLYWRSFISFLPYSSEEKAEIEFISIYFDMVNSFFCFAHIQLIDRYRALNAHAWIRD